MEYSFWGDDDGLSAAPAGSKGQTVDGSALAMPAIDRRRPRLVQQLQGIRAGDLNVNFALFRRWSGCRRLVY